ncbi:unnamed protein product, partial [Discosporangium mesarthrocarpum]
AGLELQGPTCVLTKVIFPSQAKEFFFLLIIGPFLILHSNRKARAVDKCKLRPEENSKQVRSPPIILVSKR